jgi:cytosine/adenosine deaminase-related metal-dependent hydrolase
MKSANGMIYRNGEFIEGSAIVKGSKTIISESRNPEADVTGWIVPKTVNCHTHLGDGFITRPEGCTVEELVAPPNGLKHRMLRTVGEQTQVSCMRESITSMSESGTSHFIDFRESGLEGTRRLLMASLGSGAIPVILGRPETSDANEISALLSVADGIGISAISDLDDEHLNEINGHVKATGKILGLHASETKREDFGKILDLKPNILVHMIEATSRDMKDCAAARVPVAICPSSNKYFGIRPPLEKMLEAGITVCLGSDNAMLAKPDILGEVLALREIIPASAVSDEEILRIALDNGGKVLNSLPGLGDANMPQPNFFVIEGPVDKPFMSVLRERSGKIRMFDKGGIP